MYYHLLFIEPQSPEIDFTNMDQKELKKNLGEPLRLQCKFSGIPEPNIRWYKDDLLFEPDVNDTRVGIFERNTMLDIKYIKSEDEGKYRCEGRNRLSTASAMTTLKISSKYQ